jgi:hypothetical protein
MRRVDPPSGAPPPQRAKHSDGTPIDLEAIAERVCERYRREFPDEGDRYGEAGITWCLHDNQYILAWAVQDARDGTVRLAEQTEWLARVLGSRGFPVARLVRNLEIASEAVHGDGELGALAADVSRLLVEAADGLSEEARDVRSGHA